MKEIIEISKLLPMWAWLILTVLVGGELLIIMMIKSAPSGFEDEDGFHTYQEAYEHAKESWDEETRRANYLERSNEALYRQGYDEGFEAGKNIKLSEYLAEDHETIKVAVKEG